MTGPRGPERLGWPPVGPWHPQLTICEWLVWLEEEAHLAGDDDEVIRLHRRLQVAAGCWLWDHEFPGGER
ncbi:MAG: hypothetical protein ABR559_02990 [Gemmatimonadota bacterium]